MRGRGGRGGGRVGVEHPPGGLARPLVLNPHELGVEGEVVSDRVLKGETKIKVFVRKESCYECRNVLKYEAEVSENFCYAERVANHYVTPPLSLEIRYLSQKKGFFRFRNYASLNDFFAENILFPHNRKHI